MNESRSEEISIDNIKSRNGKPVTKMAISPESKCIVTYSQDDNFFVCWSKDDNKSPKYEPSEYETPEYKPLKYETLKYEKTLSPPKPFMNFMNFKVSDNKIIIFNEGKLIF